MQPENRELNRNKPKEAVLIVEKAKSEPGVSLIDGRHESHGSSEFYRDLGTNQPGKSPTEKRQPSKRSLLRLPAALRTSVILRFVDLPSLMALRATCTALRKEQDEHHYYYSRGDGKSCYAAFNAYTYTSVEQVRWLLARNIEPTNLKLKLPNESSHLTPYALWRCCCLGETDVVQMLLRCSLQDPNYCSTGGTPPLYAAVSNGHLETVKVLLADKRVDADQVNNHDMRWTALHAATSKGSKPMIKLLLRAVNDPNVIDQQGRTPFALATANGDREIAELLLTDDRVQQMSWYVPDLLDGQHYG